MINLDDRNQIALLDKSNVLSSIEQLPDQIKDAWEKTSGNNYQDYVLGVDHIVVAGMGGSSLGAAVVSSLAKSSLKCPLELIKDYSLPKYVNQNTLVILSSYSGTTEETLAAAIDAKAAGARIAAVTSGGDLEKLIKTENYPHYLIDPRFNPSNQPRMAIGYAIVGLIGLLKSFGLMNDAGFNIHKTVDFLKSNTKNLNPESGDNLAKTLAYSAESKIIYLVSAEHLCGANHVMNNQLNENAKHLTVELQLPELNHHYMEGLRYPESTKQNIVFWFINSNLYSPKLQLRTSLTKDVVTQNGYTAEIINITTDDKFTQAFELIQLGSFINFYLAMIHGIDPTPIPWVDYFKDQLKKHS